MNARIVVVGNQKGGSGKTTVSVNLAACWGKQGLRVLLVDADPQESAYDWMSSSGLVRVVRQSDGDGMADVLMQAASMFDAIVVDLPPGLESSSTEESLKIAHDLLIPVRPSGLDITAAVPMVQFARKYHSNVRLVVNQQPASRRQLRPEVIEALAECRAAVCETSLGIRVAFTDCVFARSPVIEYEPSGKAALEIAALAREVWDGQEEENIRAQRPS